GLQDRRVGDAVLLGAVPSGEPRPRPPGQRHRRAAPNPGAGPLNAPPNAPTGLPTVDEIRDTVRTVLSGEAYDLDPKTTSTTNPVAEAIAWLQEKIERLLAVISIEPDLARGGGVIS